MSFVNFLLHGPSHPSFNHFYDDTQLQPLSITPLADTRSSYDVANEHTSYRLTGRAEFVVKGHYDRFFYVKCVSLEAAQQTWEKFNITTTWIRNGSAFLSLASLGAIYWKPLPGNYGRIITGVAGAALAGIAFLAHYRKSEIPSMLASFPSIRPIAEQICNFRNYLLRSDSYLVDNPLEMLAPNLRHQLQDFFTQNELYHLLTNVLFVQNRNLSAAQLYLGFSNLTADDPTTEQGSLIQAYAEFRRNLDFSEMQENVESGYHAWVDAYVKGQISPIQDPENFSDANDKEMADLFNRCYLAEMENYWIPDEDEYFNAFGVVCANIATELKSDTDATKNYLNWGALTDFKNALYGPSFVQHFRDVVEAMNKELKKEEKAAEWLQKQFEGLEDGTIKSFLLESLQEPEESED